ncbi:MAG: NAD-dependent epimerase/dehydratase family protein [Tistlia sp.]|uniref:NAD-dependent epimerase/dehydratase family protein n=1 Tax=Tistlia sp. TaxID=3057121 RepID=UPI0034A4C230
MRRICLVGAGVIAETHAEVLSGLPNTRIAAVVDPSETARRGLAGRWSVPAHFADSAEAIAAGVADRAHILTPPNLHARAALPWLQAGLPALIEKPVAATVAESAELRAAAEAAGIAAGVNHNFLHHPAFLALKDALDDGSLGPLRALHCSFNVPLRQLAAGQFGHWMFDRPLNLLLEQAVHPLSQVVGLAGKVTVRAAQAGPFREISPGVRFYESCTALLEGEALPVTLQFRVGAGFPDWTLTATCDDGVAVADMLGNRFHTRRRGPWIDFVDAYLANRANAGELLRAGRRNASNYLASLVKLQPRSDPFFKSMQGSIAAFHEALDAGRPPRSDLAFGADLVALCAELAERAFPAPAKASPTKSRGAEPVSADAQDWDVAVLGGTGFIGRHTVAGLLDAGHTVGVMARNLRNLPALYTHPRVRLLQGDVRDPEAVGRAIGKAGIVVNLAHGGGGGSFEEIRAALVGSAVTVAEACLDRGVRRLVHVGSIAGLYLGEEAVVTGETPADPQGEQRADYARAKAEADEALLALHRSRGLPVVVLRPGLVVGAGTSPFHSGLGLFNNEQHCVGWNRGDNPLPFVLAEDVAAAIEAACRQPDIEGRSFNLVGAVRPSAREYLAEVGRRTGRPLVFHPQAPRRLWAEEVAKWGVKRAIGRRAAWPYFRDIRSRGLTARFDVSDAQRALGWQPVSDPAAFYERCLAGEEPAARPDPAEQPAARRSGT